MSVRPDKIFDFSAGELPRARLYEMAARVYNFAAALVGLIVVSPVLLIVGILIKVSSRGPVLYRGQRVGKDEQVFTIYKFRTLGLGAEEKIGARLLQDSKEHVTPIGRILRKRKIDEFPQLFNVLRGDMNLVGPRPVRPVFLENAKGTIPGYAERFKIPPGVTGLAQLRRSYYLSPRNKLRYERIYLRKRSILLDFWIIFLTFTRLLSRQMTALTLLLLLVLFTLFLPESLSANLSFEALGRRVNLINLAIFGLGVFFVLRYLKGELIFLKTPVDRVVLGFVAIASAGILLEGVGHVAVVTLLQFACTGFGLYYFVANSVNERAEDMTLYMKGIAVIAFVSGLAGVIGFLLMHGQVRSETIRATLDARLVNEFLRNRDVLLSYFVLCLPLLLAATLYFRSRVRRAAGLVCFVASIGFAASYFSKRGMLVLGGTLLLYGWRHRRERTPQFLAAALVVVLAVHGLTTGHPPWDLEMPIAHVQEQLMLQARVLEERRSDLLLGSADGAWRPVEVPETVESGEKLLPPRGMNNMYLTILMEHGIIALFFLVSMLMGVLRCLHRGMVTVPEPALREFLWAILCGMVGILVNLFFFDAFRSISVQIPFWIFAGLGMGIALKFGQHRLEYYRLWHYQH
jgi:lipopolysaccharide/colanic/teichoic acid biosynthesis glycosyltransferase